jgi:hypothetical protein
MTEETVKCLVAQRTTDGKYLMLDDNGHSTSSHYVDDPEDATRSLLSSWSASDFLTNIREPTYYFESSYRAEIWTKDCVMVPFEITTTKIAKEIR